MPLKAAPKFALTCAVVWVTLEASALIWMVRATMYPLTIALHMRYAYAHET
jgi:hypothetical protein